MKLFYCVVTKCYDSGKTYYTYFRTLELDNIASSVKERVNYIEYRDYFIDEQTAKTFIKNSKVA